ncbi:MAG: HlyC/CorC family transporter [Proteobacteria bacterium]|nr:HlyC/CorC family transporter [Pseudomonadota bacterium]MBI3496834.1 HlyC/CorC family transporter [Pseudomonadota bacterium]
MTFDWLGSHMIVVVVAIIVLILISAFFSLAETALTAASRPRQHQLAREGNRRAAVVNELRAQSERLIGTVLLGNNLVNILASALATGVLIAAFGEAGVAYATAVMTVLILVFAEVLPKTLALNAPDRLALALAPMIRPVVRLLAPATRAVQLIVRGALRLFGIRISAELGSAESEEELRGAIELHKGPGGEVKEERAMLRSILDLDDVEVGQIMNHRKNVTMIDSGEPPAAIAEQVLASPYTRIPLYRGQPDNVVGVLHAKALLKALQAVGGDVSRLDIPSIAAPPWFIPETTTLLDQLRAFRARHEHFAVVVDEYGSLMGIVTLEDILEEIVGDITDEHDIAVAGVRPQPDGSYIVDGSVTIRDLNREFEWSLPDEAASTVAGLVLHESRRIPDVGQEFTFHGFRFAVLRRQRNQITLLRIAPPKAGGAGAAA